VKFYIGNTDKDWFDFLAERDLGSVNFWKPGTSSFRVLESGDLFLFRLKSPINKIAGGGFFVNFTQLPLTTAWDAFEQENGVNSFAEFRAKIFSYRGNDEQNPIIGCTVLTQPFFLPEDLWIPQPANWHRSIVQGKTYDSEEDEYGWQLWQAVQASLRIDLVGTVKEIDEIVTLRIDQTQRFTEYVAKQRLGQGAFRSLVIDTYGRQCAITREKTLPVLHAAHIKPYTLSGPHDVRNGLLLRSDLHTLFDQGYVTVTTDYRVEVSKRIREEYENGRAYYALHGKKINLPRNEKAYPDSTYLDWHNNSVYKP
jgi:putative restriction endonuclease